MRDPRRKSLLWWRHDRYRCAGCALCKPWKHDGSRRAARRKAKQALKRGEIA